MTGSAKVPHVKRSPSLSDVVPANPITPLAQRSMFWRPVYVEESAWLEHIPFAFWLVEAQKPRVMVELGTGDGVSYFAFCQAVERLGLDTRCFGIDLSAGSSASLPEPSAFDALKAHNEAQYSGFSRLLRSRPDEASRHFEEASIDLLHIDGLRAPDAVLADLDVWLGKLSPRAIVLIHDIQGREHNSGLFRTFRELARKHPHFEFTHGCGLGVLGIGAEQEQRVDRLFQASAIDHARHTVHQVFARLGGACSDAYHASRQQLRVGELAGEVDKQRLLLSEFKQSLESTRLELNARSVELDRTRDRLQGQLEQHALERGMLAERADLLQQLRNELKEEVGRLQAGIAKTSTELTAAGMQLARVQGEALTAGEGLLKLKEKNVLLVGELARQDALLAEARVCNEEARRESSQLRDQLRARESELVTRAEQQGQLDERRGRDAALTQLNARLTQVMEEAASSRERLAAMTDALAASRARSAGAESQVVQLQQEAALGQNVLQQRDARIQELEGALAQQAQELSEFRAAAREREASLALSTLETAALQQRNAELEEALQAREVALEASVTETACWQQRSMLLEGEVQGHSGALSEAGRQLAQAAAELQAARLQAEAERARLKRANGNLARERDSLAAKLQERFSELALLIRRLEEREAALAHATTKTERLQQRSVALEDALQAAEQQLTEAAARASATRFEADALRTQLETDREGCAAGRDALASKLAERFRELALLTRMLEERDAALALAATETESLQQRSVAQEDALQVAEQQLVEAEARASAVQVEADALRTQLETDREGFEAGRDAFAAKLAERFRELALLTRLLEERDAEILLRGDELAAERERVARLKETFSWQVTAPVRALIKPFARQRSERNATREKIALIARSGLFDESWYLKQYPEVARSGMAPIEHYLRSGAAEEKNPGPAFNTGWYLRTYADVAGAEINPLVHYIRFGRREGRACLPPQAKVQ